MTIAKLPTKNHSAVMNQETYNVLMLNGKIKNGRYKGYKVEIHHSAETGTFFILNNKYIEKKERGEHEATN